MCGITGLWDIFGRLGAEQAAAAARRMNRALSHRGPDDEGYFDEAGLWLAHRRLSIIDLSAEGHQPMISPSGRYVIVFNGEVFNHKRLRPELERHGVRFRGHSDTEVMLAAVEHWGLRGAVERFIGMFAFALWDRKDRCLALVRDRLGIKPLYYGWAAGRFVFGSELKALRAAPGFANAINRDALTLLLRHNYIPAPHSIYEGVYKLLPGTMLSVDTRLAASPESVEAATARAAHYWSAREVAEGGARSRYRGTEEAAATELERLLRDAIALRMEADVPLGAFLSGGVDSSTVVALMQAQSGRPVRTFSIGFHEAGFDEAQHAKAVARHLGTNHTELYVTSREALEVVPKLPEIYDEPFSDSSQIPTFLVSQLARRHVTVSLSGDGGDELFGGYNRYFYLRQFWSRISHIPFPLRRAIAHTLDSAPTFWGAALERAMPVIPRRWRVNTVREKIVRLAGVLKLESPDLLYHQLVSHWHDPAAVVLGGSEPSTALTDSARQAALNDYTERMMYTDLVSYLPDDILAKVDRASMAASLEARVPLLDHRVLEFAWRLPLHFKIRNGEGKRLLRQVLYRYVPKELIERPKQGFGVPIGDWLRGPLRDWAEALLDEHRLRGEGFFDPGPIRKTWSDHLSRRSDEHYRLWDVLMFQSWLEAGAKHAPQTSCGLIAGANS